jgi:hypothetical protein
VRTLLVGFIALFLAAPPRIAAAAVVRPQTTESLTRAASRVVLGRVAMIETGRDEALRRTVVRVAIDVSESLKGAAVSRVVVQQLGVPGDARFTVGEEVLIFVREDSGAHFMVGMAQGKFRILRDRAGRVMAERSFRDLTFLPRSGGEPIPSRAPVPLDDLRRAISKAGGRP